MTVYFKTEKKNNLKNISVKKTITNLICLVFLTSLITSCTKEDPSNENPGNSNLAITLDCLYNTDITLTNQNPEGIDYIVDCEVEVRDGIFSIEPGTTIQFKNGASLVIENDGILRALGKSGDPISMIGTNEGSASWRGIYINSNTGANQLEHVNIKDAGDGESFGLFSTNHAAVTFQGRFTMSNCTIENSGDNGILSEESLTLSTINKFENNTIIGCKRYPILINQNHISDMDLTSCTFNENGINMLGLHQDDVDRLNKETTFEALDIPYFIEDGFELYAPLTLEAGVEIVMGVGSFLTSTSNNNQYLLIQGSQSNHVTIRGKESLSGYWEGIYIRSPSSLNIWEYLDLSDGGSIIQGHGDLAGNVTLEFDVNLVLNNCTSSRSGGDCDIVLSDFGGNPTVENNSPQIISICEE